LKAKFHVFRNIEKLKRISNDVNMHDQVACAHNVGGRCKP